MRSLYFTNRKEYYKQRGTTYSAVRRTASIKRAKPTKYKPLNTWVRYSVSYMNVRGDYGKTIRAYIINPTPSNKAISQLDDAIKEKVKGMTGFYKRVVGFEKEKIDEVEVDSNDINKIYFEGFNND